MLEDGTLENGKLQNLGHNLARIVGIGFHSMFGLAVDIATVVKELLEFFRIAR
jgi:hypothetical protein